MRRYVFGWVVLLGAACTLSSSEPQGKLVKDLWDAAYLEGAKIGYLHTSVHEVERDGQKLLRTTVELNLTVKRFKTLANLRMESGTEEKADGQVTGVFMRQFFEGGKQLVLVGQVTGDHLHVKVDNGRIERKIRWNDQVIGMQKQERLYQEKKVKPGDRLTYQSFEPTLNTVVTIRATVKEEENVEVLQTKKVGGKEVVERAREKLLRVEAVPDRIEVPEAKVQLPGMISWLNKEMQPVRSEMEIPGLGPVTFLRTTREVATTPGGVAPSVDLGLSTLVAVQKPIPRPHDTESATYRITIKGDDDVGSALATDDRQKVKTISGNTVELQIQALRSPRKVDNPGDPKPEFLQSSYFLKSDDAQVKKLAAQAIGNEKDPWRKAQLIERWVHKNMRLSNSVAFGPADQTARDLQGDCRQHAMLTTVMCRAAEVPSRTAVGLVYVDDRQKGPVFGFHMWSEVWVQGQWLAIDATLGQGYIGAAHIKIADHSWYKTESLTPFLPVQRVLMKMTIEVVEVK